MAAKKKLSKQALKAVKIAALSKARAVKQAKQGDVTLTSDGIKLTSVKQADNQLAGGVVSRPPDYEEQRQRVDQAYQSGARNGKKEAMDEIFSALINAISRRGY